MLRRLNGVAKQTAASRRTRRDDGTRRDAEARRRLIVVPQPFFRLSGTPLNVLQMCRALTELGYEVHMVTLPMGQDIALPNLVYHRVARVPFLDHVPVGFSFAKAAYDVMLAFALVRLLRRHRFAAVHAIEEAAFFAAAIARLFGTPLVADLDSDICHQLKESPSLLVRCLAGPAAVLRRLALRMSACAVTVARHLTDLVGEVSPSTPVFEIGDIPQETATRPPDRRRVEALREELGVGARRLVVYTGNFDRRQGIELLLRAFRHVVERFPDAMLLLVGGDPERRRLMERLARSLGIGAAVRFVEPRPLGHMPEFMALADVLVSPRQEPYVTPLKVYTYMASERPIVATDLPTHTRVLDERSAILVPPTAEGLADGLVRALADPAHGRRLAARARRLVERNHSYAGFKRGLGELYAFVSRRDFPAEVLAAEAPPPVPTWSGGRGPTA